jgi:hypothetical protein
MRKAGPSRSDYARVIVERDEAIADRDYLLSIFHDLATTADITALTMQLAAIRAMVSNVPPHKSRSKP